MHSSLFGHSGQKGGVDKGGVQLKGEHILVYIGLFWWFLVCFKFL